MKCIDADNLHYKEVRIITEKGARNALVVFAKEIRKAPRFEVKKTGHWIETETGDVICSECGRYTCDMNMHDEPIEFMGMKGLALVRPNYCSYCGSKNVSD